MNCYWKNNDFDKSGALLISNVEFANYKASFIYITPSILVKISFILGPISITPIVYKNQVSGYGFWTKCFMVFSYSVMYINEAL
jgi:hypothetical protein